MKGVLLDDAGVRGLLAGVLPPIGKSRTVFDSELTSFSVRISPQGVATFYLLFQIGNVQRRKKIGRFITEAAAREYPRPLGITAAEARIEAKKLRTQVDAGVDVALVSPWKGNRTIAGRAKKVTGPKLPSDDIEAASHVIAFRILDRCLVGLMKAASVDALAAVLRDAIIETIEEAP